MKNTMKIGALLGALAIALLAPSAHAATQIPLNDDWGTTIPCYGTRVSQNLPDPCASPYSTGKIVDAWNVAAIIGWTGPTSQVGGTSDASSARITALEQQNATLQSQVQALTQKVNQLANQQPVGSVPVQQVTVTGDYDARIAAIEKEQKTVSGYMYILEQRIGENYARMLDLFAPVYKVLKLK